MVSISKFDIHNSKNKYLRNKEALMLDDTLTYKNRELLLTFLNDCELGKTIKNRQKKKIKERRLYKYLYHLKMVARNMGKDFDKIEMQDMERFISELENNKLVVTSSKGKIRRKEYSPNTQRDIKIALRKFYKWLWGECVRSPEIVAWFDTSVEEPEVNALDENEVMTLVEFAPSIMKKALIWTLYETGARSEEFLNIRMCHVKSKESHYVLRIEFPKTFKRSPPVHEGPIRARGESYLKRWLDMHPNKNDPQAQLFPMNYRPMRNMLKELGIQSLGKRVTPHLLRDSRATYLAGKQVGRYQMCKLMGWSMSSRMPDRYIDRAGVAEEEAVEAIRRDDLSKSQEANLDLKRRLIELEQKKRALENVSSKRSKADNVMTRLLCDKEIQAALMSKIKELGLTQEIINS